VPQSVRHGGEGFTSPRKEYVLRVCIDPWESAASAGCDTANLESNVNHANYYTTEET
jgi:hypothetical protein